MHHRIRIIKACEDGTEFSIEITTKWGKEYLDKALEDAFGSLRSFNAEMEKQDELDLEAIEEKAYLQGR